jgi:flagellar basal body-associated protein FliL
MSTTLAAALLALAGIIAVAGVSYVFYLVGRAEDRERAEAAKPPPPEPRAHEHPEHNGRLARERRRPLPPRRP